MAEKLTSIALLFDAASAKAYCEALIFSNCYALGVLSQSLYLKVCHVLDAVLRNRYELASRWQ